MCYSKISRNFAAMKKSLLVKLFSLFLAVLIFTCSIGVIVKNHYCSNTKVLKSSFFNGNIECDHNHHQHEGCDFSQSHFEQKSCCLDYSAYLRFVEKFSFSSNKIMFDLGLYKIIVFDFLVPNFVEDNPVLQISQNVPPSLLSGKERLISFSQLKLHDILL